MKQILCLSHTPWQARPNRTQQLLARLNDVQILFFEPPLPHNKQNIVAKQGRRMRPHITVYTLPSSRLNHWKPFKIQQHNTTRNSQFIQKVLAHHHFKEPVLWCTCPDQAVYLDHFVYSGLVYDCFWEWGETFQEQERDLVCHAEVVFAASPNLAHRLSFNNDHVVLLPNGVNHQMFTRAGLTIPFHLSHLAPPILGRVGDLDRHLDLEPLHEAAQSHPEWTFLLMGRVTPTVRTRLQHHPNLVLTGPVDPLELPDYLYSCQVLFDLLHAHTRSSDIVSPRLYEYLASGKPIVTMAEPERMGPFPDLVYTAHDSAQFIHCCTQALEEPTALSAPHRQAYASQAAWSDRAREVVEIFRHTGLF